jgi:hypothetical protein
MDTWILRTVRTTSRRRFIAWTVALAVVCGLVAANRRYVENFLGGPHDMGQADLDAIRDVSTAEKYYARVRGSEAIDTGIHQVTVRTQNGVETGRSITGAYFALVVGDRLLVCRSSSGAGTTFEGELAPMPAELDQQIFDSAEMRELRPRFYPFYLTDESFRYPGYWALAGLAVFGILLVKFGGSAWKHLQDPSSHPVVQRVATWGDPIGVAVTAEREARAPRLKGGGGWLLTDRFLIQKTFFTFELLRLDDLLWAYKKVTKHSVNFIPTGKTYDAVLSCKGGSATVQGSEKAVDEMLAFAAEHTPWAVFGFSKEIEGHFLNDATAFCAAVESRKNAWARQQRAQSTA